MVRQDGCDEWPVEARGVQGAGVRGAVQPSQDGGQVGQVGGSRWSPVEVLEGELRTGAGVQVREPHTAVELCQPAQVSTGGRAAYGSA